MGNRAGAAWRAPSPEMRNPRCSVATVRGVTPLCRASGQLLPPEFERRPTCRGAHSWEASRDRGGPPFRNRRAAFPKRRGHEGQDRAATRGRPSVRGLQSGRNMTSAGSVLVTDSSSNSPLPCGMLVVGTPTDPQHDNETQSYVASIRRVVRQFHAETPRSWEPALISPGDLETADSHEIAAWTRRQLVHRVEVCVVLLTGPSTGSGRAVTWALECGVPVIVLVKECADTSPLGLARTDFEGDLEPVVFSSTSALVDGLRHELRRLEGEIDAGPTRRARIALSCRAERQDAVALWRLMTDAERARAAEDAGLERGSVRDLLGDGLEYGTLSGALHSRLMQAFGFVWPADLPANGEMTFNEAAIEYGWTRVERGLALTEARSRLDQRREQQEAVDSEIAIFRRDALPTTLPAWNRLFENRCARDDKR